ncbi:FAD-dependent oxidoreductase [Pseudonocardia sp. GCM10023141]|uniref:FAD-dependent oxidoreductase n=1 Tax=Pseudonocardia sp. GCM10023141 TaxID=3252653 RepID=UPI00361C6F2C
MDERVIVVGAGPTGLMLAHELALAGISCTLLEKRSEQANLTRAFGMASRTLELLDARGLADELVAEGNIVPAAQLNGGVSIDLSLIESRFNFMLITPQSITERMLEQRCVESGVEIVRGAQVTAVEQDGDGVTLTVTGPEGSRTERAAYVVGCDGTHSAIRSAVGITFVGKENVTPITLADVELRDRPSDAVAAAVNREGVCLVVPFGDGYHRMIIWDRRNDHIAIDTPLTTDELRDSATRIAGTDFGMSEPRWKSRFLAEQRQAEHYRAGRVLIAGDAAHSHSPIGAQGMNTGIGDAMNLGWKLAAVVRGTAKATLLDTFESERHPVGRMVLALTGGLTRATLIKSDIGLKIVQFAMRTVLSVEAIRRRPRGLVSGVGIAYAPRGQHPHRLAGKRALDLELAGGQRLYEALRNATFVLVDASPDGTAAAQATRGWGDRVAARTVVRRAGVTPQVLLVRPDGYVAWAADSAPDATTLAAVLSEWCGPAKQLQGQR